MLDTEELIAAFGQSAGALDATLCDSTALASVVQQLRAASDIMKDGTNGDPSKTCDGISVGIGFSAQSVKLTGRAAPAPAAPDPCAK